VADTCPDHRVAVVGVCLVCNLCHPKTPDWPGAHWTDHIVGALGFGWVCGSSLYSLLYPKEPELTDKAAIDALIESIIGGGTNGNPLNRQQHARYADQGPELNLHAPRP
jgi:hypothetical protein